MKKTVAFILFALCGLSGVFAQSAYKSLKGHVVISGKYRSEAVLAESYQLNLLLDYTTKEFKGKLDLSTLDTGIDSLNALLSSVKPVKVLFSGVIPDDNFTTWEHLELEFNIPVTVQLNGGTLNSLLNIKLNHSEDSRSYACLLSGIMDLDLSEFENKLKVLGDTIEVKFTQVLMRRNRR